MKSESTHVPTEYKELFDEYKKRLALERRDSFLELLLVFNAFGGIKFTIFILINTHAYAHTKLHRLSFPMVVSEQESEHF